MVEIAINHTHTTVVTEIIAKRERLFDGLRTTGVNPVTHIDTDAAIAHEQCNSFCLTFAIIAARVGVEHIIPLIRMGGEIGSERVLTPLAVVISISAGSFRGIAIVVHHLRHRIGHATGLAMDTVNQRGE